MSKFVTTNTKTMIIPKLHYMSQGNMAAEFYRSNCDMYKIPYRIISGSILHTFQITVS